MGRYLSDAVSTTLHFGGVGIGRRGKKWAFIAVVHAILPIVHYLLSRNQSYLALGVNYFDELDRRVTENRLVRRLQGLGYEVTLQPVAKLV